MAKGEWVLMGPEPHFAHCERCGAVIPKPALPAPINMVTAWMKAAVDLHRDCKPKLAATTGEGETDG